MGLTSPVDHQSPSVENGEPLKVLPVHRPEPQRTTYQMETKHRTLIQAAVLLILLVCVAASNGSPSKQEKATAAVAAQE